MSLGALYFIKHTGPKHTATLLFFHGQGSNGQDVKEWFSVLMDFSFPHVKVLFPTAPLQQFTPNRRRHTTVWFDREDLSIHSAEKLESFANIEPHIKDLIKKENEAGIPSERIIVAGFSMGGTLALHTAYRWDRNLAGAFVLSTYLNENSIVYKELQAAGNVKLPPLVQVHGDMDDVVPFKYGDTTYERLKALGVQGSFIVLGRLDHSISYYGLNSLREWIARTLPPI